MFDSRYEVYLADTPESRAMHHQVRYQVFCVERGFEEPQKFGNYQESDRWDRHSHHFVVQDKESGAAVAAMRIVLPSSGRLPVEDLGCITDRDLATAGPRPVAEVSRICMVRDRRPNRGLPVQAVAKGSESEVLLGLLRAIHRYSWDNDISHFYMLVTQPFARLLRHLGLDCVQAGEAVEHRGRRAPYLVDVDASWQRIVARSGKVAEMFARHYLGYLSHAAMQPLRQRATVAGDLSRPQRAAA